MHKNSIPGINKDLPFGVRGAANYANRVTACIYQKVTLVWVIHGAGVTGYYVITVQGQHMSGCIDYICLQLEEDCRMYSSVSTRTRPTGRSLQISCVFTRHSPATRWRPSKTTCPAWRRTRSQSTSSPVKARTPSRTRHLSSACGSVGMRCCIWSTPSTSTPYSNWRFVCSMFYFHFWLYVITVTGHCVFLLVNDAVKYLFLAIFKHLLWWLFSPSDREMQMQLFVSHIRTDASLSHGDMLCSNCDCLSTRIVTCVPCTYN